jgi:hypothetical protein
MRWVPQVLVLGLCLLFTRVVGASRHVVAPHSTDAPKVPAAPEYDDYRLTLVAVDAVSISMVVGGAFLSGKSSLSTPLIVAGISGYAFGAPIVHVSNEQPSRALESLALRLGLPVGSLFMGGLLSLACGHTHTSCAEDAFNVGLIMAGAGVLTAMIVDDAFLGKAIRPYGETPSPSAFRLGIAPLLEPRRKTRGLSLVGAF